MNQQTIEFIFAIAIVAFGYVLFYISAILC